VTWRAISYMPWDEEEEATDPTGALEHARVATAWAAADPRGPTRPWGGDHQILPAT